MIYLLHISDLHLVVDPQWNNMKNAILYSVRQKLSPVPKGQKLLVVTGDFHNFRQKDYVQAKQFLPQLIGAMDIKADKDVFVIPGNHDVSNTAGSAVDSGDRQACIQAIKTKPDMLHDRVGKLLKYYDEYTELMQSVGIYRPEEGNLSVRVHVRTWRDKLNLLHLNTALLAEGGEKSGQMLDILTATGDEIRGQLRINKLPGIAIGHNSFFDLDGGQQKMLSAMFLQENISAYLCGDRHQRNSKKEENRIVLSRKISSVSIPNIVGYRGSADEGDTYSDFGMIWHEWEEDTGRVSLEFMKWDPEDQGELQQDGEKDYYFFQGTEQKPKTAVKNEQEESCWLTNDYLLERGEYSVRDQQVRNYLLGSPCMWSLAFSDRLVVRDMVGELYDRANEGGIYALTGAGGEGKTTILRQLCVKLLREGTPVFCYRGSGKPELPAYVPEGAVFVLDNPPDSVAFKRFLETSIERGQTLILGARQNEWNLLKKSLNISGREVIDIPLPTLNEREADAFAGCVWNNLQCRKSREEMKELFLNNSYGFLYAAMLMAVNNKNSLDDIAHRIIHNLQNRSPKALQLLAHIVLAEQRGVKVGRMQFKEACNKLEISPQDAMWALSREISLNGQVYQTRHDIISKLFYQELYSESGLLQLDEIDEILTFLLEYQLRRYSECSGRGKTDAWNSIKKLSGGLAEVSLNTRKYLIDRILDEIKTYVYEGFDQLFSAMGDEEVQILFCRQCFDRKYHFFRGIRKWCRLLLGNGAVWDVSEPYSPAWILKEACISRNGGSSVWLMWAQLERKQNGAGDYRKENTARWIYREACINRKANGDIWLAWGKMEEAQGNIGNYESENTARWIYREACINHNSANDTWLAWGQMEERQNEIGNYESENTARWIYREACIKREINGKIWLAWGQMEERQNEVGDYKRENTADWIYRKACSVNKEDSDIWLAWGQLEAGQGNIGNYDEEGTARWIYREACLNHKANSSVWLSWGRLEEENNNIGDYQEENTARWIYREVCINRNVGSDAWFAWGQLEAAQGNMGGYERENTTRWIYREACINRNANDIWRAWAQLEIAENNIGSYEKENTARWIYREACINNNVSGSIWELWMRLEAEQNRIGDDQTENTAAWICTEGIQRFPDRGRLYVSYAAMEMQYRSVQAARDALRKVLQDSSYSIGSLAILEFFCGNIDSGDDFCMLHLMEQLEKRYTQEAFIYLHHCYILLGWEKDAESYHKRMMRYLDYRPSMKYIEEFIRVCREKIV